MKIGLFGRGFVGDALYRDFTSKGVEVVSYDKYKEIGTAEEIINAKCDAIFLCLPTPYVEGHGFDQSYLEGVCRYLADNLYSGFVIIKSTTEPGVSRLLAEKYGLNICHNPEFLTARTAKEDFKNQKHIVLGYDDLDLKQKIHKDAYFKGSLIKQDIARLASFYRALYPGAKISVCTTEESESMKIFVNTFYAVKVQMFNEFYFLCQRTGADFEVVRELMLNNGWINEMHTNIPGPDGSVSYGGACFPKDTSALLHCMKKLRTPHMVLEGCVNERNSMRKD